MKKNLLCYFPLIKTGIKRFLLTMNLALVVSCLNLLQVNANGANDLQQLQVRGKVTDSNTGELLVGATVIVKGTNTGATSSADGTYTINVPDGSAILVFSFIGYTTQEVNVSGRTTLDVALISETTGLEEVVVVGYGTQKKETMTGSISKVEGAEIVKSPSVNVTTSLAGKLPGLVINQRTGQPGAENLSILIRGSGTFNDNNPLVVIDGVPRDNTLQDLNAQDIESITVLKDASAAIYGARAANGVILITTK
ncbi:MAG TPA: TonB-dependent receptor plug domain-containing protein, partial [Bacteroidales bacterium]|nr:TonB-dependent receptor plug domain-containing protein [Bacteroidales bacterium]